MSDMRQSTPRNAISTLKGRLRETVILLYMMFFLFSSAQGFIVEQSGNQWDVAGYTNSQDVSSWYPGGMVSKSEFTVTVHRDTSTKTDSIVFHTSADGDTSGSIDLSSYPAGVSVAVADDSGELDLSRSVEGQWSWAGDSDGGALELPDDWTSVTITPSGLPDIWFRGESSDLDLNTDPITIGRGAPFEPSDPQPADGASTSDSSPQISAVYSDPADGDDDTGTLHFYDGSNNLIGSCSTTSGNRCSVTWSGLSHGSHDWYAVADDGTYTTRGPTWTLVINSPPGETTSPTSPDDGEKVYGTSLTLEMPASDPDGDSLTTEFFTNRSGSQTKEGSDTGTSPSVSISNLDHGKTYEWWGVVSDPWDSTESQHWTFWVNSLAGVSNPVPGNNEVAVGSPITLGITASDPDSADNNLHVYFFQASDDSYLGKESITDGEEANTEVGTVEVGEKFKWYVKVSDTHENMTSKTFTFTRLSSENFRTQVGLNYQYSAVIVEPDGVRDVTFTIENMIDEKKNLLISFEGVNAYFMDGSTSKTYTLGGKEKKRFTVRIDPEGPEGLRELVVNARNTEVGVTSSASMPVYVRNYPTVASSRQVPGISPVQVVVLLIAATLLYYLRL